MLWLNRSFGAKPSEVYTLVQTMTERPHAVKKVVHGFLIGQLAVTTQIATARSFASGEIFCASGSDLDKVGPFQPGREPGGWIAELRRRDAERLERCFHAERGSEAQVTRSIRETALAEMITTLCPRNGHVCLSKAGPCIRKT